MKIKLRYCKECRRNTIQAKDKYLEWSYGMPNMFIDAWYCPNCGSQWQPEMKEDDKICKSSLGNPRVGMKGG